MQPYLFVNKFNDNTILVSAQEKISVSRNASRAVHGAVQPQCRGERKEMVLWVRSPRNVSLPQWVKYKITLLKMLGNIEIIIRLMTPAVEALITRLK